MSRDAQTLVLDAAKSMGNARLLDLMDVLVRKEGLTFTEAAKTVYMLWKDGGIDLLEPKQSLTVPRYVLSLESLWFWVVTSLVAATVLIALYAVNPPLLYLRYVLGAFYVLYLPGSMLIEALYPRGEDLDRLERLALSIGLSLAVVPLIGLLLNYLPWGIRLTPIIMSLAIFAETMATVAIVRKHQYYVLGLRG